MVRMIFPLLAACILTGCYSFAGHALPPGMRTVVIEQVADQTRTPDLADEASRAIVRGFEEDGRLRPVDADGDALLRPRLVAVRQAPASYSGAGDVRLFRVTVALAATFLDRRDGKTLFEGSSIEGIADYDPVSETEADARSRALREAVRRLIDNTVAGW